MNTAIRNCSFYEFEMLCYSLWDPLVLTQCPSLNKVLNVSGYGRFHYFLLATCGFVSTSEEMDVISMSFILPSAECDLNLNTHTKGWLNCIIFIGKEHVLCQHEVFIHSFIYLFVPKIHMWPYSPQIQNKSHIMHKSCSTDIYNNKI
jgi:hypothetical protein